MRNLTYMYSRLLVFATVASLCVLPVLAQETLGGITGEVTYVDAGYNTLGMTGI